jgi:hypothetical protein
MDGKDLKKRPLGLLCAILLLFVLIPDAAKADIFKVNKIYYVIKDGNECWVNQCKSDYNFNTTPPSIDWEYNNDLSGEVVIPETVTYDGVTYTVTGIETRAFLDITSITSIVLPSTVRTFGKSAFNRCTNLESINIPSGMTSIAEYAFGSCEKLKSIDLPASVTSIGANAFWNCSSLQTATLGNNVTSIGESAFEKCAITNINLSEGVNIGESAFYNCRSLTSVDIPENASISANSIFSGCSSLAEVSLPESLTAIGSKVFDGCSNLEIINSPASLATIGAYAFRNCSKIPSFTLPEQVTVINASTFEGCSSMASFSHSGNITSIADAAFKNCSSLPSFALTKSMTTINASTFEGCSALATITTATPVATVASDETSETNSTTTTTTTTTRPNIIPANITTIGDSAFKGCTSLAGLTLSEGLTSIGSSAFEGCSALVGYYTKEYTDSGLNLVKIPDTVTTINSSAFKDCTSITNLWIGTGTAASTDSNSSGAPAKVLRTTAPTVTIGEYAFNGDTAIISVTSAASVAPTLAAQNVFSDDTYKNAHLYIDATNEAIANSYNDDKNFWYYFKDITTEVEQLRADDASFSCDGNGVTVSEGAMAQVYSISGAKVYQGSDSRIELAPGIYLLRLNNQTHKILIK